jgi:hypothetical protein
MTEEELQNITTTLEPEDWNETSAPWPFTEEDILDEDIELPDESSEE